MRYPVLFQKAIETLYAGDTVPDVVLEIGPHQTLVSPIKQVSSRWMDWWMDRSHTSTHRPCSLL